MPEKDKIDWSRYIRLSTYALMVSGPSFHLVYSKILPKIAPGTGLTAIIKKVMFVQLAFSTTGLGLFFYCVSLLEGKTLKQAQEETTRKFWKTLLINWQVWPVISIINFTVVPPHF